MFPTRMFANRMFAPRMFPKVGAEPDVDVPEFYYPLIGSPSHITFRGSANHRAELLGNDEARPTLRGAP